VCHSDGRWREGLHPSHLSCCACHITPLNLSIRVRKTGEMTKLAQSGPFISHHHWHQSTKTPRPHDTPNPMHFRGFPTRRPRGGISNQIRIPSPCNYSPRVVRMDRGCPAASDYQLGKSTVSHGSKGKRNARAFRAPSESPGKHWQRQAAAKLGLAPEEVCVCFGGYWYL